MSGEKIVQLLRGFGSHLALINGFRRLRARFFLLSRLQQAILVIVSVALFVCLAFPPPPPLPDGTEGVRFFSREGRQMRQFREETSGSWSDYRPLSDFPDHLIRAVLFAEDRRFGFHPGIDPVAILRAFMQNLRSGRIVSGASTIHQQLVRLHPAISLPSSPYLRKPIEAWYAMRYALWYSSDRILESYLNQIPLKWNSRGIPSAARRILGRDIAYLSPEESALLAVLIRRSQTGKIPLQGRYAALAGRLGLDPSLSSELMGAVFAPTPAVEGIDDKRLGDSSRAPHFVDRIRRLFPAAYGDVQTTVSDDWNDRAGKILDAELEIIRKRGAFEGAVVALEKKGKGETERFDTVIYVGSSDYTGEEGQVDGAHALRNGGSTLKPFVYALAIDELDLTPFSILSDREIALPTGTEGETYRPLNYDLNYWGDLSLRKALVTSRNIPAVELASTVGVEKVYALLERIGMDLSRKSPEEFGPGIALGISGTSVLDLARAYSIFVSEGRLRPLRFGTLANGELLETKGGGSLLSQKSVYWITDILSDRSSGRRAYGDRSFLDFPFDVAAKTGTSKDFRDSWTVGYTDRYVVAVWVGDFRGASMNRISGVYGAGRIFHQVMRMLESSRPGNHRWHPPSDWEGVEVCALTGCRADGECSTVHEMVPPGYRFSDRCEANERRMAAGAHHILSPSDGETYLVDPHAPETSGAIPIHILGCDGCRFRLDGASWKRVDREFRSSLPLVSGAHTVEFLDRAGRLERIEYNVE